MEKEKAMDINPSYFERWSDKIQDIKKNLLTMLEKNRHKKIAGYGASATSTTLIYHFELQQHLKLLIDDNPGKIDTYSPGLHIPVKAFSAIESEKIEVVVVLAWRYVDIIKAKLKGRNIEIICPLPQLTSANI